MFFDCFKAFHFPAPVRDVATNAPILFFSEDFPTTKVTATRTYYAACFLDLSITCYSFEFVLRPSAKTRLRLDTLRFTCQKLPNPKRTYK